MNKHYLLYTTLFLITLTESTIAILITNKCPYTEVIHLINGKKTIRKITLGPDENIEIKCRVANYIKRVFPVVPHPTLPNQLISAPRLAPVGAHVEHLVSMLPIKGYSAFELKQLHTNRHL